MKKIRDVQQNLLEENLDGWLLYDFHGLNPLARQFLEMPEGHLSTRRFFYWIPVHGEPVKIVHAIEADALDHLPGEKHIYLKWQTLEKLLGEVLKGKKKVAMEYSPRNAVPYVSKVDGGTLDLVRGHNVDVVSSALLLQRYTSVMDNAQLESHFFAARVLDETAAKTWEWIAESLKKGAAITEYDVQQQILKEIKRQGCVTDIANCSVNAHSAMPHYAPQKGNSAPVRKGDFILIDLWCKQKGPRAVFADITRVAVADKAPTPKQAEIFHIVRQAQKEATDFIHKRYAHNQPLKGYEVDEVARKVVVDAGYGDFFTHRTGHNIYTELHGPGAHLDSLETQDDRYLLPKTCFSVEPGIYLPGEFGIRLEYDVYLGEKGTVQVTGGIQEELKTLF